MRQCDMMIHAGIIITQNEQREVLHNASLVIRDGVIAAIGPTDVLKQDWQAAKSLEYADKLVMPGLVNAHTHAAMTFLRGLADDLPLMDWLEKCIFPVEARLTAEITRLGSLLGYAEMLACGTTACIDMYLFEESVFEAADVAGIRCMGGEAVFAFPSASCPDYREALAKTERLASEFAGNDRLKVAVNPHGVYTTTPQILEACRDLALKYNLPLHIHLAESKAETDKCMQQYGMRPVEWCKVNGLLDAKLICAHLVDVNQDEIAELARAGACAAHNPSSNMKLASGAAPVAEMLAGGLPVALGTDGPASNNTLNMFSEMGRAALLAKVVTGNPTALPAPQVLDMATLGGAFAFGSPHFGALSVGKAADCIALNLNACNLQPMLNPVSQVVYAASGHECAMTMVAGEILYENGKYARFDFDALQREIKSLRNFALGH